MASDPGPAPDALSFLRELEETPYKFDFFQAMRRLENENAHLPRLGAATTVLGEFVRLGQDASLAFAPSAISSFSPGEGGRPPRLGVAFLGLFGPNGPLPLHLTEYVRDRIRNQDDPTLSRFADLFHHRMISLFYRAWAQAQPTVSLDRPDEDRFGDFVGSLMGMGVPELQGRDRVQDHAKLFQCGHFSLQTRHADGLCDILADYFEIPVAIEEFQGAWIEIPEPEQFRLGESEQSGCLGESTILGSRVWDRSLSFRVACGPLQYEDYERLLPDRSSLGRLHDLVKAYVGDEFLWDVVLILARDEIPETRLGEHSRLGWTSWLKSRESTSDRHDLVLASNTCSELHHHPTAAAA